MHPFLFSRMHVAHRRPCTAGQGGFSLIELMIASVLAVIIAGMMFAVLSEQEKTAGKIDVDATMQGQLRFALISMSRQIRMTGYGIGFTFVGSSMNGKTTLMADSLGGYGFNGSADSSTGSDRLIVAYRNPMTEFELSATYVITPGNCTDGYIRAGREYSPLLRNRTSDVIFSAGDILVCFDESHPSGGLGLAWDVSGESILADGARIFVNENNYTEYSAACPDTDSLPVYMTCGSTKGSTIGFYLKEETLWMADSGFTELADLETNPSTHIPMAKGIEDFQVAFCVPVTIPVIGVVSESTLVQNTLNCLSDPASVYWLDADELLTDAVPYVRAVRLTLVAKGKALGKSFASSRPDVEDHTGNASSSEDLEHPRMVQSVIVQLPNYRYLKGLQDR